MRVGVSSVKHEQGRGRGGGGRGGGNGEKNGPENVKASNFHLRAPLMLMEFLGLRVTVPSNPRTLEMCSGMQDGDRTRN